MIRRMKGDLVRYDKVKISDWDALEAGTRLKYLEEVWEQVNKEYDRFCGSSEDSIGNECSVAFSELVEEYLPLKSAMQARIGNVLTTETTDQTQIIKVGDQRIQTQLSEPARFLSSLAKKWSGPSLRLYLKRKCIIIPNILRHKRCITWWVRLCTETGPTQERTHTPRCGSRCAIDMAMNILPCRYIFRLYSVCLLSAGHPRRD